MKKIFFAIGLMVFFLISIMSNRVVAQMEFNPEGETYVILIDGTTRLYDPSIDYGALNLKAPPPSGHISKYPKDYIENLKKKGVNSCTFNVTYNNFTAEAQAAFQYAVDIWQTHMNSTVPIKTYASWEPMGAGVLGSSTRQGAYRNFSGAPISNVWYPVSVAEAISGTNLNGTGWEIYVRFNSDFSWYLGTDGNPGGQYDFVSTVLHELCHGLGFYSSFSYSGGTGSFGSGTGFPYIYDVYIENGAGDSLYYNDDYPNGSTQLGSQLVSNNIYFNSPNSVANYNGQRPPIYAPTTWNGGSSISHVGEIFNGTYNALMTYSGGPGDVEHTPGPVVIGMLKDMGWTVANIAPVMLMSLPDIKLVKNSTNVFYARLMDYFYDVNQYRITDYSIVSSGNVTSTIIGDSLYLSTGSDFTGKDTVYISALDSALATVTDTVIVTVSAIQPALSGKVYGSGTAAAGGLVLINSSTGSVTGIGTTGYTDIKGLSVNPINNELYGVFIPGSYAKLVRIDASTGSGYDYRIIPGSSYRGLAFDNEGNLYIATTTGTLCSVNIETGDTTLIGTTGISSLQSITVNPLTNQMFGLTLGGVLYKINKQTAASVQVGTTGFSSARYIAFDQSGKLFGLSGGSNQPFYSIDTTTGAGILIGNTGVSGLSAIAIWGNTIGIDDVNNGNPNQYSLTQNYPNPFNPTTSIKYTLGSNAKVSLKVFNTLGQEVRTLVNGKPQIAGKQFEVIWDGKDNAGHSVASGIYFYRLEAGSYVKTKKMMLIK